MNLVMASKTMTENFMTESSASVELVSSSEAGLLDELPTVLWWDVIQLIMADWIFKNEALRFL